MADTPPPSSHIAPDRLVAFTDGLLAIAITIAVLELRVPTGSSLAALRADLPIFVAYALSFLNIGIYWNNHHHLFGLIKTIDGAVMWANLTLLFWLSLIPFTVRWIGEVGLEREAVVAYGAVLTAAALSYTLMVRAITRCDGRNVEVADALGRDRKGRASLILYIAATALAWWLPVWGFAAYFVVAFVWLIPDRRISRRLEGDETHAEALPAAPRSGTGRRA